MGFYNHYILKLNTLDIVSSLYAQRAYSDVFDYGRVMHDP